MALSGQSYWSEILDGYEGSSSEATFDIPMELIPSRVAPINKQIRVVVNAVE